MRFCRAPISPSIRWRTKEPSSRQKLNGAPLEKSLDPLGETIERAVAYGNDTDTTAAIAGGLWAALAGVLRLDRPGGAGSRRDVELAGARRHQPHDHELGQRGANARRRPRDRSGGPGHRAGARVGGGRTRAAGAARTERGVAARHPFA